MVEKYIYSKLYEKHGFEQIRYIFYSESVNAIITFKFAMSASHPTVLELISLSA